MIDENRKKDFELYAGISNLDEAMLPALRLWNAYWGPLGKNHITKKHLIDNKDLVFELVEAVVPSLVTRCIEAEEDCIKLEAEIDQMRADQLLVISELTKLQNVTSRCIQVDYNFEGSLDIDDMVEKDDTNIIKHAPELPKWHLEVIVNKMLVTHILTHTEYAKYFSHVKCETKQESDED